MKFRLLFFLLVLGSFTSHAQSNGLVGHWNFNGNANDVSGNGLNGVVSGATLTAGYAGTANTAYQFNGSSDHIDVAYNSLLNLDSFTICTLVKPMGFNGDACQGNVIVAKGVESSSESYYLCFTDNSYDNDCNTYTLSHEVYGAAIHSSSSPSSPAWYSNSDTIALHSWYCVTLTYHQDSLRLYIDGTLRKTLYYPDNFSAGTDGLGIGYYAEGVSGGYPYWFNGAIDDMRLYNRALSSTEVSTYCDSAQILSVTTPNVMPDPQIIMSPNPAHNNISIQLPDNTGISDIQLINTLGQLIVEMKPTSKQINLDISVLPAGLYIIKVECNGQMVFKKILKE